MHSPFPGMDPYLEYPAFWSSFHTRMMVAIAEAIEPQLSPLYYVDVESRTYQSDEGNNELLIGIPDAIVFSRQSNPPSEEVPSVEESVVATQPRPETVAVPMPIEVKERYLEVREMGTDDVIAVIELLSPKNKRSGEGRTAYEKKRRLILGSETHLVELDLLRGAKPMAILGVRSLCVYRILISRSQHRPRADLYGITLQQPLPSFPIPLKPNDPEPIVPLQELFDHVYERGRYGSRIDYHQSVPLPKLSKTSF
ncbi:MAG: DUF4058 family protein [Stigonema ocellatum SAG 48.90 = DSM 106950]|nr:DUF4058 family protein [Stigonema ocellatum SAG 48.90 = DSM 106950]